MPLSLVLIALNLLVWGINIAYGLSPTEPTSQELLRVGGNYLPATLKEPWRLFTAMFLHAGIVHLGFNMLALFQMGPICESFFGRLGTLTIYLTAGLFGAMTSLYFGASTTVSVGASGAIFGVQGAILSAVLSHGKYLRPGAAKKIALVMAAVIGANLLLGLTSPAIDLAAHVGGLFSGFVVALLLAKTFDGKSSPGHMLARLIVATVFSAIFVLTAWETTVKHYVVPASARHING